MFAVCGAEWYETVSVRRQRALHGTCTYLAEKHAFENRRNKDFWKHDTRQNNNNNNILRGSLLTLRDSAVAGPNVEYPFGVPAWIKFCKTAAEVVRFRVLLISRPVSRVSNDGVSAQRYYNIALLLYCSRACVENYWCLWSSIRRKWSAQNLFTKRARDNNVTITSAILTTAFHSKDRARHLKSDSARENNDEKSLKSD